ncbi:MAG: spore maturation protein [bacterium]|nr:spore maturation protein [bacterium]
MNAVWVILILLAFIFSLSKGKPEVFTNSLFEGAKDAVQIFIRLIGILTLWMGILKIIEDSGLIDKLSRFFRIFVNLIFKDIPKGHPAVGNITLNIVANVLGAGNAATPAGLKAMENLQEINKDKEVISDAMILFIVINTASVQLIPFTLIGLLSESDSIRPAWIVLPVLVSTFISLISAIIIYGIFRKLWRD